MHGDSKLRVEKIGSLNRDLQVQDSETEQVMQLTLDATDIDKYHARVEQLQSDWRDALAGWGEVIVMQCPMSWQQMGRVLLQQGLVKWCREGHLHMFLGTSN